MGEKLSTERRIIVALGLSLAIVLAISVVLTIFLISRDDEQAQDYSLSESDATNAESPYEDEGGYSYANGVIEPYGTLTLNEAQFIKSVDGQVNPRTTGEDALTTGWLTCSYLGQGYPLGILPSEEFLGHPQLLPASVSRGDLTTIALKAQKALCPE